MPWLKNGEGSETTYTRFETDRKKAPLFEKNAKNFGPFAYALRQRSRPINKVLCFFFSKKNRFLSFAFCTFGGDRASASFKVSWH
jgi:hypothetical protein